MKAFFKEPIKMSQRTFKKWFFKAPCMVPQRTFQPGFFKEPFPESVLQRTYKGVSKNLQ